MRKGKGRRQVGPWVAAIAVLAVAVALLLTNVVFVVRGVDVAGNGDVPAQDVVRLSGIPFGARLSAVNEDEVRDGVESDGRLAFVGLERRLPNRLVLTVRRRTRDAMLQQSGRILVVDTEGYVTEITDRLPEDSLVYVTGLKLSIYELGRRLEDAEGRCDAMTTVLEALRAQGAAAYVSELSVADPADLRIVTRTGMVVQLGNSADMDNKIIWMAGAVADLEARGELTGVLDVSSGTKADYRPPNAGSPTAEPTAVPDEAGAEIPQS